MTMTTTAKKTPTPSALPAGTEYELTPGFRVIALSANPPRRALAAPGGGNGGGFTAAQLTAIRSIVAEEIAKVTGSSVANPAALSARKPTAPKAQPKPPAATLPTERQLADTMRQIEALETKLAPSPEMRALDDRYRVQWGVKDPEKRARLVARHVEMEKARRAR